MYNEIIEVLNKAVVKDVRVYNMKDLTPFYDYSIIGSVNSARQGISAINYLKKEADKFGWRIRSFSSSSETTWFLIDLDEVVVHLFVGEERRRYNLDEMYGNHPVLIVE